MDVFGKALQDFYGFGESEKLWLHNNYGRPEDMPVDVFFRSKQDLSELEEHALTLCEGRIFDIGAGAGVHSLILQNQGINTRALELSATACEIMRLRGVKNVVNGNIFSHHDEEFDTLLLLMNGIGLCGDIDGLHVLLPRLKKMLAKDGQIILDSSDISYLYYPGNFPVGNYYGEISYRYEYKGAKGDWFKWLYIHFDLLSTVAERYGLVCELIFEDDMDQYLARLSHKIN